MIRARYNTDGDAHTLVIEGHADYAEYGHDIVCAGASSLVYALMEWLAENSEDTEYMDVDETPGSIHIACEGGERTAVAFDLVVIGLEMIMDQFPDHIQISRNCG